MLLKLTLLSTLKHYDQVAVVVAGIGDVDLRELTSTQHIAIFFFFIITLIVV